VLFDTTFVIDLQRETVRKARGRAYAFLQAHADALMRISIITYGELAEGFAGDEHGSLLDLVRPFEVLELSREAAWCYGRLSRAMRESGARIGDNDLWIAATAAAADMPLVTRDAEHFARVPQLRVVAY
jgi:tRNA(fMet)-specific endonuclease VapC